MLRKRQYNILQFVHDYTSEYGFAPSMREIGLATGITSTSIVNYNIEGLIARGDLVKSPGKSRALALTEQAIVLFESDRVDSNLNRQRKVEPLGLSGTNQLDRDMSKLREENRLLKDENDRLRREHKNQIAALRHEIRHLAQELNALRPTPERYPA